MLGEVNADANNAIIHGLQTSPQLDFTHLERALNAERQVCKLVPTLLPKEVRDADGACHSDAMDGKVCAAVF
jgi:hypothetical protein